MYRRIGAPGTILCLLKLLIEGLRHARHFATVGTKGESPQLFLPSPVLESSRTRIQWPGKSKRARPQESSPWRTVLVVCFSAHTYFHEQVACF